MSVHIATLPSTFDGILTREQGSVPQLQATPPPVQIRTKPAPSSIFTGRKVIMEKLDVFFSPREPGTGPRREYVLHGMGGAGKTQTALKFAQTYQDR